MVLNDPALTAAFKDHLTAKSVHWKRNFGCIPTQHASFADCRFPFGGPVPGRFPKAEYVGDNGVHFGVHQHLSADDVDYLAATVAGFLAAH